MYYDDDVFMEDRLYPWLADGSMEELLGDILEDPDTGTWDETMDQDGYYYDTEDE